MAKRNPIERIDEKLREMGDTSMDEPQDPQGQASDQHVGETTPPQEPPPNQGDPPKGGGEDENGETYKQRWTALQGILNGERRKVEQLQQQVQALSQQLSRQSEEPGQRVLPSDASVGEIAAHLADLQDEYGENYTKAMRVAIRGEAAMVIDETVGKRIESIEQRIQRSEEESEEDRRRRFADDLERKAKGWRETIATDDFQYWLDSTVEPMSGSSYRQLFDSANKKWDLDRIAAFFNTFNVATGKADPGGNAERVDPRETLVTPGSGGGAPPGGQVPPGQNKIWTLAEVKTFYKDLRSGRWRGREAEAGRIEAEIDRANAEGRIR